MKEEMEEKNGEDGLVEEEEVKEKKELEKVKKKGEE